MSMKAKKGSKKAKRTYNKSEAWYASHGKKMQQTPMAKTKPMVGAKHFEILDHIPTAPSRSRMTSVEAKKYENTLKLLVPNKRSTMLNKSEKNKMVNYAKRFYPDMKIRTTKGDSDGKRFIVWREA